MYRVLSFAAVALLVGACSVSRQPSLSLDYSAQRTPTASLPKTSAPKTSADALGGEPSLDRNRRAGANTRVARLPDSAPPGSFERAPAGALADRDYTATRLDPELARDLINQYRSDKGLKPLRLDARLTEAAKAHSRDLSKWDRISHYGSDGSNPWDRVKRAGYRARLAAENVGTGQKTIDEVMKGWQKSPGHNKNLLLPDAEHMGIALVNDPKTEFKTFWTLVIGSSM